MPPHSFPSFLQPGFSLKDDRSYRKISSQVEERDNLLPHQILRQVNSARYEWQQLGGGGQPAKTLPIFSLDKLLHETHGRTITVQHRDSRRHGMKPVGNEASLFLLLTNPAVLLKILKLTSVRARKLHTYHLAP